MPAAYSKEVFEYVNQANPFPVADFTFAANPRNDADGLRDGSVPGLSRSSERKRAKPWYPSFGIWRPPGQARTGGNDLDDYQYSVPYPFTGSCL